MSEPGASPMAPWSVIIPIVIFIKVPSRVDTFFLSHLAPHSPPINPPVRALEKQRREKTVKKEEEKKGGPKSLGF